MSSAKRRKFDARQGMLPGYFASIQDAACKERYANKLQYTGGVDPYEVELNAWQDDVELWPSLSYIHVGMYLLYSSSAYTQEQLRDYKNLDCYQKFTSGWVKEVYVKKLQNGRRALIAKVNHSQRLSEKPLTPWIVCEEDGMILAVHCDCMAGLGESCSHAACLMWAVEAGAKRRSSLTVTDKKAYWVLPGPLRKVEPVRVKEMKFSDNPRPSPSSLHHRSIEPPSEESVSKFMEAMSKGRTRPAVLSLVHPYSDEYIPKSLDGSLPKLLTELFDKAHLQATLNELVVMAEGAMTSYKCTMSEVQAAEEATKDQANSKVWFQLRAGRVTASNLKAVCSTKPEKPSVSLVMTICYPELKKFRSSATTWGCKHEVTGRKVYNNIQSQNHDGFSLSASGLHISLEEGFMAASPDGLVTCNCCGDGICEIKCPYCHKDDASPVGLMNNKIFVHTQSEAGVTTQLKQDHSYYYQIQAQLFCSGKRYCDLVVWSPQSTYIQRITRDDSFLEDKVERARTFVKHCVLPELLGRWFSRPSDKENRAPSASTATTPVCAPGLVPVRPSDPNPASAPVRALTTVRTPAPVRAPTPVSVPPPVRAPTVVRVPAPVRTPTPVSVPAHVRAPTPVSVPAHVRAPTVVRVPPPVRTPTPVSVPAHVRAPTPVAASVQHLSRPLPSVPVVSAPDSAEVASTRRGQLVTVYVKGNPVTFRIP